MDMDMDAVTSFCCWCWGNRLGIKAARYQRIILIQTFNRLQQKAERSLLLLLNRVQFLFIFFCNLRLIFFSKLSIGK